MENLSSNRTVRGGSPRDNDKKRSRRVPESKSYTVKINYATRIPIQAIFNALKGQESEQFNEAVRVLDVLLRQHATKQGCFHSSFRATLAGLSLNMDVSTTMIVKPGKVVDFLLENQNVRDIKDIDWTKARRIPKVYDETEKWIKSRNLPCLDVGKPKRPVYIPLEFCELISLQRYTKSLSDLQRASLVEKSRQKPHDWMKTLMGPLNQSNYNADPLINSTGITISTTFSEVQGRVLELPKLKFGNGGDLLPHGGRWNFNNKTLVDPKQIKCWAIVNFSARCDIPYMCTDLLRCSGAKGMLLDDPYTVIQENYYDRCFPAPVRPWKRKCLVDFGIVTQCIAPTKINDQYLTYLLLKINAKMGGINSLLSVEYLYSIPLVSRTPTIFFGMDVSHGSPGRSDVPSIAALEMVATDSRYRASVRAQSTRVEMIDDLFKPVADKDEGMIRELLDEYYTSTTRQLKPQHIIIFRDGVSESQFNQVLNIELEQIMQACKFLDETWDPKFMLIVAQKTHHTKFFQQSSDANVPPGTIIDNRVCHPKHNDFYMCAQNGPIGTTRHTHYHVLLDQIGFSPDDLQELVHSLSYVIKEAQLPFMWLLLSAMPTWQHNRCHSS
nr:hypothetical protein [Tanacetum cinerariifolium]